MYKRYEIESKIENEKKSLDDFERFMCFLCFYFIFHFYFNCTLQIDRNSSSVVCYTYSIGEQSERCLKQSQSDTVFVCKRINTVGNEMLFMVFEFNLRDWRNSNQISCFIVSCIEQFKIP